MGGLQGAPRHPRSHFHPDSFPWENMRASDSVKSETKPGHKGATGRGRWAFSATSTLGGRTPEKLKGKACKRSNVFTGLKTGGARVPVTRAQAGPRGPSVARGPRVHPGVPRR